MDRVSERAARQDRLSARAARWLLFPTSRFRTAWDIQLVVLVVYTAFSLPLVVCFKVRQDSALVALDQAVDAVFWADLLLNFVTTFEVRARSTRSDRDSTRRNATRRLADAASACSGRDAARPRRDAAATAAAAGSVGSIDSPAALLLSVPCRRSKAIRC